MAPLWAWEYERKKRNKKFFKIFRKFCRKFSFNSTEEYRRDILLVNYFYAERSYRYGKEW